MIFSSRHQVHLTRAELNGLRQAAARNGRVINRVDTPAKLLHATLDALPSERLADMLEFLETGSSPLIREASARR